VTKESFASLKAWSNFETSAIPLWENPFLFVPLSLLSGLIPYQKNICALVFSPDFSSVQDLAD